MINRAVFYRGFNYWLMVTVTLFPIVLFYQNCDIQRPQSGEQSSFSLESFHAGANVKAMQCQTCHETQRKFAEHFAGQDCVGCHTPGTKWWMGTTGGHSPTPVQCNSCHSSQGTSNKFPLAHHNIYGGDCIDCHKDSITNGFTSFLGGIQKHSAALLAARNCASCHADAKPYDSYPAIHPPTLNKDCIECHVATVNSGYTKWITGDYTHTSAQLNTCATCHGDTRPQDSFPITHFAIGATDCSSCHQATVAQNFLTTKSGSLNWKGGKVAHTPAIIAARNCASCHSVGGIHPSFPATHIKTTGQDCISCHQASVNTGFINWTGGVFAHSATLIAGKNCASCHAADRPPTVALTNINPSIAMIADKTHFAAKDCYSCHGAPAIALKWRGANVGQYEHTNANTVNINFCLTCHLNKDHPGKDGAVAADSVGDGKCQQCHTSRRSWRAQNRNPNL